MGARRDTFVDATPRSPCHVCGATGFCTRTRNGRTHICRRESVWDGKAGRHAVDELGERWTWFVPQAGTIVPAVPMDPKTGVSRASTEVLDRVYRDLLDELSLAPGHLANLTGPYPGGRGLALDEVRQRGYRSLNSGHARIAKAVATRHGDHTLAAVPGFYRKEDPGQPGRSYWSIAASGLLVPVRNTAGRIVAFQVRLDNVRPGASRYIWLSSAHHGGPGPGTPSHVPLHEGRAEVVRITEGALKADAATLLDPDGLLTIGFPGIGCWRAVLPVLRALGARTVHIAFDADCRTNRRVATALQACARELHRRRFRRVVEVWTEPKGIDDLFASGGVPETVRDEW